jgi:hypothetical protein
VPAIPTREVNGDRATLTNCAPRIGAFSISGDDNRLGARCTWTDMMYVIHGFAPGEVHPTLDLWLTHVADEDRTAVQRAITQPDRAAAFVYGLRDARGRERQCVLVVIPGRDGAEGYLIDMTEEWRRASAERANAAVRATSGRLAPVQQAIGVIVAQRDVDADAAARLLEQRARERAVDVTAAAREVIEAAARGEDAVASRVRRSSRDHVASSR